MVKEQIEVSMRGYSKPSFIFFCISTHFFLL
jgi:hypothetical protein